jgi:hypothetical protein
MIRERLMEASERKLEYIEQNDSFSAWKTDI